MAPGGASEPRVDWFNVIGGGNRSVKKSEKRGRCKWKACRNSLVSKRLLGSFLRKDKILALGKKKIKVLCIDNKPYLSGSGISPRGDSLVNIKIGSVYISGRENGWWRVRGDYGYAYIIRKGCFS